MEIFPGRNVLLIGQSIYRIGMNVYLLNDILKSHQKDNPAAIVHLIEDDDMAMIQVMVHSVQFCPRTSYFIHCYHELHYNLFCAGRLLP
jgi:hypothetical protein